MPQELQPRKMGGSNPAICGFWREADSMPAALKILHMSSQKEKGRCFIAARRGSRENSMLQKKGGQKEAGQPEERTEIRGLRSNIRPVKVRVFEKNCNIFTFLRIFML